MSENAGAALVASTPTSGRLAGGFALSVSATMNTTRIALATVAAAVLAGCSTTKLDETPKAPVETRPAAAAPAAAPAPAAPVAESRVATVDLATQLTNAVAAADKRVVYFDFDSFVVKPEYQGLLGDHAKRLNHIKTLKMSLEGHADERGGSEYNLALGQKRAEAVVQQLTLAGVAAAQVEPVSFGKERPAVQGSTEAAWAKNRRVELKDK